jgi:hypothetical protein
MAARVSGSARLDVDPQLLRRSFNREPFGFSHNLGALGIFELPYLRSLAEKYRNHQSSYMVASGASAPGERFRAVKPTSLELPDAIDSLQHESVRILLKHPETFDPRFRELMDGLVAQVAESSNLLKDDRIERLTSSVFLTSTSTLTPFHFDPSAVFFFQITGEKVYHLYAPAVLSEPELEQFYFRGLVDIGQVDLAGRDPKQEFTFSLSGGKGLHQPQNSPHWVETRGDISISYSFFFETLTARKASQVRGFNHYIRKVGITPTPPGRHPHRDVLKADAMRAWIPLRKTLSAVKSATLGKHQQSARPG